MALSALDQKSRSPTDDALRAVLGKAYPAWTKLLARVVGRVGPVAEEWQFTSASTGWGLRVVRNGRVIVYVTPQRSQFLVSFVIGEKAAAAARAARLSASVLKAIEDAPRYAEGRGVRIVVRGDGPVATLARLAQIKCES